MTLEKARVINSAIKDSESQFVTVSLSNRYHLTGNDPSTDSLDIFPTVFKLQHSQNEHLPDMHDKDMN
jgi:hypothetical protein